MSDRTCSVEGCDRDHYGRDFCRTHHHRWWLTGDPGPAAIRTYRSTCQVQGCTRKYRSNGYCKLHLSRFKRHGDPLHVAPHPLWVGDEASYYAVHHRLRCGRGPAKGHECHHCGLTAQDWAYNHSGSSERIDETTGLVYSTDLGCYIPLCRSCHRRFDNQTEVVAW